MGLQIYGNLCMNSHRQLSKKSYEESFKLEVIQGLLTIKKVKPTELNENKNQHVTNVYSSIEGQDNLQLAVSIENENKETQNQKKKKTKQKDKEKKLFQRRNAKCVCSGICAAKSLKEYTVQHEIKELAPSKAFCCIDELKPKMITTVTATSTRRRVKYEEEPDSDENDKFKKEESDASDEESVSFEEDDHLENTEETESADDVNVSEKLHETWYCLSLPWTL